MRRTTLSTVAIAAVALALPASASAVPEMFLDMKASPAKASTATKKVPIKLDVSLGVKETEAGKQGPTTKTAAVFFPKGAVYNGALFPKCSASVIASGKSTEDCPRGSILGKGKAIGVANAGEIRQDDLTIVAVNGGPSLINLFVEGARPLRIQSNLASKLTKVSGKYGLKLAVDLPKNLQEPAPGTFVSIELFRVQVGGKIMVKSKGKTMTRGLIEVNECKGTWGASASLNMLDGSTLTQTDSVKCSK